MKTRFSDTVWFSIIIPIYNAEKFLKRCIDSILSQSFKKYEVLLIDDGSTDHSNELCNQYALADERVKVYRKENGGAFQSRLYATQYARGKYIIFADADDYYLNSTCFEEMYELTKEEKFDLIQFGYYKKYNHMRRAIRSVTQITDVNAKDFYNNDYPILLCNNYGGSRLTDLVWNKIYRKELFDYKFDNEMSLRLFMGEDLVINLCVISDCKNILFTPQIFYVYNDLTGGTTKFRANEMDDLNILKEYQIKYLEKWRNKKYNSNYNKIEQALFDEAAAWFFLFLQQAMDYMNIENIKNMIKNVLEYPAFKKAKKYYIDHPKEKWLAVDLLREGDIEKYIQEANKEKMKKPDLFTKIKNILLIVYKRI